VCDIGGFVANLYHGAQDFAATPFERQLWGMRPRSIGRGRLSAMGRSNPTWRAEFSLIYSDRWAETNYTTHLLNILIRISSSNKLPFRHDEMKPRSFNHVTNLRFTSLPSIFGVAKPGLISGSGSGNECRISLAC
jgi:hypothetical protein